ncbi:hypothetical protein BLA23254_07430 [Burkholderia lata]|uniref:Uncharacterized protein n=1 Tax=Burkholderia lata (strain ATCC 17760 / DSM 23089 / LMG 22485 / NCIMB 9086 / R18194 / 383) TaxID=482957 RepID=A0A6P2SAK1_BURL3|nr:hypothetical protein [Burkholderia lata]VWC46890.1 hypothetical protein BLA23254_07430 [Burkholderia lata]
MSDKIEMTITINELVSPLLFERLSACPSARRRAALLKALAESALRQELTGRGGVASLAPVATAPFATQPSRQFEPVRPSSTGDNEGFEVLSVGDGSHDGARFDDSLHEQLGAWG